MTACPAAAKSFFTVLDQTKPPAPVWRCSSGKMASSASARCKAACKPGATAAIRWLRRSNFGERQPACGRQALLRTFLRSRSQHYARVRVVKNHQLAPSLSAAGRLRGVVITSHFFSQPQQNDPALRLMQSGLCPQSLSVPYKHHDKDKKRGSGQESRHPICNRNYRRNFTIRQDAADSRIPNQFCCERGQAPVLHNQNRVFLHSNSRWTPAPSAAAQPVCYSA
jgi:hypothetical protein